MQEAIQVPADVLLLQETRTAPHLMGGMKAVAGQHGWNALFGTAPRQYYASNGRRIAHGGNAIWTRSPMIPRPPRPGRFGDDAITEEGRVVQAAVPLGNGKDALHVFRFMAGQAQIQQELGMNDYKIGT